jgi:hypothetical protein
MLTTIRRASSQVTRCGRRAPAGFVLEIDVGERLIVTVADEEAVLAHLMSGSSTDQGGGKCGHADGAAVRVRDHPMTER